ncbi:MAG: hypothetical protein Q9169_007237 [Polycauliona sp. 2 TL-2023]
MWNCGAPNGDLAGPWWVGDSGGTPCQSGTSASFTAWPSADIGKVIQRATATSSAASSTNQDTSSTPTTSANPSPASTTSDDGSGDKLPMALGAGIGIPLGIAALGLLAFLLWRIRRQKQREQQQKPLPPPNYGQMEEPSSYGNPNANLYQPASEMNGDETSQGTWHKKQVSEMDSQQMQQNHEIYTRE